MNQVLLRDGKEFIMTLILMTDAYKPIANSYNLLSRWYSLGQIAHCRNAYLAEIAEECKESQALKVCYVGAGHGEDALKAAEAGAFVTVVEISQSMLEVFQDRLDRAPKEIHSRVNIVYQDVHTFNQQEGGGREKFDWIVANFFLNVFKRDAMTAVLSGLLEHCSDSGSVVISDFYELSDETDRGMEVRNSVFQRKLIRLFQRVYWYTALILFRLRVKNAFHPVYHYREILERFGWQVSHSKRFKVLKLEVFHSIRCQKAPCHLK